MASNSKGSSGASRHVEIETKLAVDADTELPDPLQHKAVRHAKLVAATAPVVHSLDATYFDTAELDLLRSKVTLRRRTGGEDSGWHLKLPGSKTGGAATRTEVQLPLTAKGGSAQSVPDALAALVLGTARGRELGRVARLQSERTVVRLRTADGTEAVEISDDSVTATRPDGSVDRWREVEVELVDGSTAHLEATVQALLDGGARPAGNSSKLGRALPLPPLPAIEPGAGAAVVETLGRHRDRLIAADRLLREGEVNGVHEARSVARRIRSVLKVFAKLFAPQSTRELRGWLTEFGELLGAIRDVDVIAERLRTGLVDEPDDHNVHQHLDQRLITLAAAAEADVRNFLASPGYLDGLRALDQFVVNPPLGKRGRRDAQDELPRWLAKAWQELRERASAALAEPEDLTLLHAVRRAAKTVRYAAESTVSTLGDDAVVFAGAVEQVQQVLGDCLDARATSTFLVQTADQVDGTSGFLLGRLHALEQAAVLGAVEEFADAWDRVEDADLAVVLRP